MAPKIDRERLHKHLLEELSRWSEEYRVKAGKAADRIIAELNRDRDTPLSKIISKALAAERFHESVRESIGQALSKSVAWGYGIVPEIIADPKHLTEAFMDTSWSPDRLTLSERLYKDAREMESMVGEALQSSMRRGQSFTAAARDLYDGYGHGHILPTAEMPKYLDRVYRAAGKSLDGRELKNFQAEIRRARRAVSRLGANGAPNQALKASYKWFLDAAEKGSKKALDKAAHIVMEERSRYMAERIARTEMSRAYAEGFLARIENDEDVIGVRWELSTRHPAPDICDFHAGADLYGMGRGVYPKDRCPALPAHPHCMCHYIEIYDGEAEVGPFNPRGGKEYVSRLSESDRKLLLGKDGSDAFKREGTWQPYLKGFDALDSVRGRDGVARELARGTGYASARGSGETASGGKSFIERVEPFDIRDDEAVEAVFSTFAKETANLEYERAVVISPDGSRYNIHGDANSVQTGIIGEAALKDARVIHNHPVGPEADSFSEDDFVKFFNDGLASLEVAFNGKRHRMEWVGERLTADEAENVYKNGLQGIWAEALANDTKIQNEQYEIMLYLREHREELRFYEL